MVPNQKHLWKFESRQPESGEVPKSPDAVNCNNVSLIQDRNVVYKLACNNVTQCHNLPRQTCFIIHFTRQKYYEVY